MCLTGGCFCATHSQDPTARHQAMNKGEPDSPRVAPSDSHHPNQGDGGRPTMRPDMQCRKVLDIKLGFGKGYLDRPQYEQWPLGVIDWTNSAHKRRFCTPPKTSHIPTHKNISPRKIPNSRTSKSTYIRRVHQQVSCLF